MADKFTPEQRRAVTETEGNMLVSASAGSGKTYVMIERLIGIVLDGKAKVSEILAVTFTEAAAAEMKQKLVSALRKRLIDGGDNSAVRAALDEVPSASISTIHKFCADLLRSYFYEIGLDPAFKIADETAACEIQNAAADKTFSELYDAGDEDFLYLVRIFRSGRSDAELKKVIKKTAEFALSEKNPEEFLEKCGSSPTEKEFEEIENELAAMLKERAAALLPSFENAREVLRAAGVKKPDEYFDEVAARLKEIVAAPDLVRISAVCSSGVRKAPSVPGDLEDEKKAFDDLKKKLGKLFEDGEALLDGGEESAKAAFLSTERTVKALSRLAILYKNKYDEMKADESLVDFSDLEHLAYKLLTTSENALASVRNKYKYAFCDEYQDVNAVQEAVLNLVAPRGLFMVGDVKQCIYAFRGCNPDIFASKFAAFEVCEKRFGSVIADGKADAEYYDNVGKANDEFCDNVGKADAEYYDNVGKAIALAENFRSADGVLKAVNNVFSATMTEKSSRINYAKNPMKSGGLYPENTGYAAMHVIVGEKEKRESPTGVYDLVRDAETEDEPDSFYEGLLVGELIEKELGEPIFDIKLGDTRPAEPKDIAVLLRNSKGFATDVIKTLSRLNVPVSSAAKDPVVDYPEIKLLIDILRLIDFYADDSPLIAVMKSSVGGFDEEELAAIRAFAPSSRSRSLPVSSSLVAPENDEEKRKTPTFLECVEYYLKEGTDEKLREKIARFDEYFKKIRLLAEFCGAGEILVRIIKERSLDLEILTGRLGELRLERVNRFVAESEKGGVKLTVGEFLKKIENSGDEISVAEAGGSNSVTVMSMHSSKGLEFPVVIIAGLGRQFNASDERDVLLLSKTRGFAPYCYDEQAMTKSTTLKRELVKNETRRATAREELRLLYVAMTRAQSKLHLVTSAELPVERNETTASLARKFTDYFSPCDMPVIIHDKADIKTFGRAGETRNILVGEARESLKEKISESVSFRYPFEADTVLPVKRAVTSISEEMSETKPVVFGVDGDDVYEDNYDDFYDDFYDDTESAGDSLSGDASDGNKKGKITVGKGKANERGTAYHKFLENLDFNAKSVDNELIRQLSQGVLLPEQAKLLDKNTLQKIVNSGVFARLDGYKIYREQPFVAGFSAKDVGYEKAEGEILVQGIIDLLAVKGDEAIILDYKATGKSREEMLGKYKTQLEIYKKAVEKVMKLKVKKTILFNVFTCETVEVE